MGEGKVPIVGGIGYKAGSYFEKSAVILAELESRLPRAGQGGLVVYLHYAKDWSIAGLAKQLKTTEYGIEKMMNLAFTAMADKEKERSCSVEQGILSSPLKRS